MVRRLWDAIGDIEQEYSEEQEDNDTYLHFLRTCEKEYGQKKLQTLSKTAG